MSLFFKNMSKLEKLKSLSTLKEFATLLGFTPKALSYILYKIPDEKKYTQFVIPKSNGDFRQINAPIEKLKLLQRRLADLLSECYSELYNDNRKSLSHGFRKNHSIITNAKNHKNKRYVFNVDLQDFFPSINFGRVRGFFIKNKDFSLHPKVATIIAQIACHNNELPQGSPCSPIISNLIGHILDIRLVTLAKKTKCTYSRYADDITFSTNIKDFPKEIALEGSNHNWIVSDVLRTEVKKSGFTINYKKTSMQYRTNRQITTGLVVNKKVNVKKEYYKNARAMCHNLFITDEFYINTKSIILLEGTKNREKELDEGYKIKGTLKQLEGILSFIYHVKRNNDKREKNAKKYHPKAVTELYRQFLFYKHFFALEKPLIICEGKTDIIYLKCALRQLKDKNIELVETKNQKVNMKIDFFNFSNNFKDVFSISSGTSGIYYLIDKYKHYMQKFKGNGKRFPVIVLLDNDDGADKIKNAIKKKLNIKKLDKLFYRYEDNLFITFVSNNNNFPIEKLFDSKVLNYKIGGKKLNLNSKINPDIEYGKIIFAEKVIRENQANIDFSNFQSIFDNFKEILVNYDKKT